MVVDTCFVIDLMKEANRGASGPAAKKLASVELSKLKLPIFCLCELRAGALRARRPGVELAKLEMLTEFMEIIYPSAAFAVVYGEIHESLRKNGTMHPLMDLLIGTLAKCESQPIITNDVDHFSLIPGLVVEGY